MSGWLAVSASAERTTAASLLLRVEGGAFASRLLAGSSSPGVRARVLGTVRWQGELDTVLAELSRRPIGRLDAEVRVALRLGLFEALHLGVPPPVATDAAAHLVRRLGKGSAAAMVNAVLRRAVREAEAILAKAPLEARLSHPRWLADRWMRAFGGAGATAAMEADQQPAPLWAWFFDPSTPDRLERGGLELVPHPWCPGCFTAGDPASLAHAVSSGEAYAQDPSSQLVARVTAALAPTGARLAELCAAPGGKTALLARLGARRLAAAVELQPRRVRLLRDLVRRQAPSVRVVAGDAGEPPLTPRSWDVVLLDAPCSGTGTLRRHPELRWRLSEQVLVELAAEQARLLAGAAGLVAPGGVLVYATCSVEPEENEALLASSPAGFRPEDPWSVLPQGTPARRTSAWGVRLLPGEDHDGFTIHALRRVKG